MAQCRQKRTGGRGLIFTVFLRKLFMDDPITRMALRTGHTSAKVDDPEELLALKKCRVKRSVVVEGHSNFSGTMYSFAVLCLERHYCGDQQWRLLT